MSFELLWIYSELKHLTKICQVQWYYFFFFALISNSCEFVNRLSHLCMFTYIFLALITRFVFSVLIMEPVIMISTVRSSCDSFQVSYILTAVSLNTQTDQIRTILTWSEMEGKVLMNKEVFETAFLCNLANIILPYFYLIASDANKRCLFAAISCLV